MNELVLIIIPGSGKEFWSRWPQTQQQSEPFGVTLAQNSLLQDGLL